MGEIKIFWACSLLWVHISYQHILTIGLVISLGGFRVLGGPGIVSGMPLDRFKVLLKCLHLNDNTTCIPRGDPGYDRLHKVTSFTHSSHRHFPREYIPNRNIRVDEAMIGFKGKAV